MPWNAGHAGSPPATGARARRSSSPVEAASPRSAAVHALERARDRDADDEARSPPGPSASDGPPAPATASDEPGSTIGAMGSLAERLGYAPDAKLLIVTCDDLGFTHSANVAVYEALRDGVATSASLMVPCPWARDAAARYRGEDVGVQLTLNAELETYRWGPITHSPSLLDGDGGFPRTVEDAWDHADLDEVRRECRAQIERAIVWGFDVSHVDQPSRHPRAATRLLRRLPRARGGVRAPTAARRREAERVAGFPFRRLAAEEGAVFPDHVVCARPGAQRRVERRSSSSRPASPRSACIRRSTPTSCAPRSHDWAGHVEDHAYLCRDPSLHDLVARAGAHA